MKYNSTKEIHLGHCHLQVREMDISGEEFYTYYDESDWPFLMQRMKEYDQEQIVSHAEIWMAYLGEGPDNQVLLWTNAGEYK